MTDNIKYIEEWLISNQELRGKLFGQPQPGINFKYEVVKIDSKVVTVPG